MYSGKCSTQVSFTDESCKILLIRPNQIPVVEPARVVQRLIWLLLILLEPQETYN